VAELHFSPSAQSLLKLHGVPRHTAVGSKQRVVAELHVPLFEQSALNMHGMPSAVQSEPPPVEVEPPMQIAVHSTGLQITPDFAMHARQSLETAAQKLGQEGASEQPAAETLPQMSLQEGADAPPAPVEVLPEPAVVLPEPAVVLPLPVPPAPLVPSPPPQPASTIIPVIPKAVIRPIAHLNIEPSPPKQIKPTRAPARAAFVVNRGRSERPGRHTHSPAEQASAARCGGLGWTAVGAMAHERALLVVAGW
jgi:hypothetical protein